MCHCQFINTSRDEKQLGGQHWAEMGILPTAPGYESLAQVHQKMARMRGLGAEKASGWRETAAFGREGWLIPWNCFTPCLLWSRTKSKQSWRAGWCGYLRLVAKTPATLRKRKLQWKAVISFLTHETAISNQEVSKETSQCSQRSSRSVSSRVKVCQFGSFWLLLTSAN